MSHQVLVPAYSGIQPNVILEDSKVHHGRPSTAAGAFANLIADGDRDAADSLSMLLELAGHEVRVAHLGRAAVSRQSPKCPTRHVAFP
jgi:hypothetical protein